MSAAGRRPDGPDDPAVRIWTAMRALVLDRYDQRQRVADELSMSFLRAKALRRLAREPLTMRALAAEIGSDAPYTSVVVDDLERRELVERSAHPQDRRVRIVSVTAAGRELAATAERILGEPPAAVRQLPAEDLAALDRILAALAADGDGD